MLGGYAEEAGARSSIRARGGGAVAVLRGRRLGALALARYRRANTVRRSTRHAVSVA